MSLLNKTAGHCFEENFNWKSKKFFLLLNANVMKNILILKPGLIDVKHCHKFQFQHTWAKLDVSFPSEPVERRNSELSFEILQSSMSGFVSGTRFRGSPSGSIWFRTRGTLRGSKPTDWELNSFLKKYILIISREKIRCKKNLKVMKDK